MSFDLYAWKSPRGVDADGADALVQAWLAAGGDPGQSPFEPSTDVGWFHRELVKNAPDLDVSSDAVPNPSSAPIWLAGSDEPPARVVAIRLSRATAPDDLDAIFGLAAKYDLVLYDPQRPRLHLPLEEMAAHASATFWPGGAIRAAVAGGIGGVIALAGWFVGIPVLGGIFVIVGGFLVVLALYTFIHEGRRALRARRSQEDSRPDG